MMFSRSGNLTLPTYRFYSQLSFMLLSFIPIPPWLFVCSQPSSVECDSQAKFGGSVMVVILWLYFDYVSALINHGFVSHRLACEHITGVDLPWLDKKEGMCCSEFWVYSEFGYTLPEKNCTNLLFKSPCSRSFCNYSCPICNSLDPRSASILSSLSHAQISKSYCVSAFDVICHMLSVGRRIKYTFY